MFVILGYLITFGCIFGVFIAHGGNIKVVLEALPFEMITIGGAAAGRSSSTTSPGAQGHHGRACQLFKGGKVHQGALHGAAGHAL